MNGLESRYLEMGPTSTWLHNVMMDAFVANWYAEPQRDQLETYQFRQDLEVWVFLRGVVGQPVGAQILYGLVADFAEYAQPRLDYPDDTQLERLGQELRNLQVHVGSRWPTPPEVASLATRFQEIAGQAWMAGLEGSDLHQFLHPGQEDWSGTKPMALPPGNEKFVDAALRPGLERRAAWWRT